LGAAGSGLAEVEGSGWAEGAGLGLVEVKDSEKEVGEGWEREGVEARGKEVKAAAEVGKENIQDPKSVINFEMCKEKQ